MKKEKSKNSLLRLGKQLGIGALIGAPIGFLIGFFWLIRSSFATTLPNYP
ncbi:TPA: hypothetical protein ACGOVT_000091 [Streptococcus suis]